MKILFFADLHEDMKALSILKNKAADVDLIVCAGDISSMEHNLRGVMKKLDNFGKKVLMIHGNHEDERGLREMCNEFDNITFLHKGVHHIGDYVFLGYGGDGFSTNDPEFTKVAYSFFKPETLGKHRIIMVTHGPPHGTVLDKIGGDHRGNKSYREFIDEVKPHLVISGHLHETAGRHEKLGRTLLINPGKEGAVVDI
ncbi:metallophosphoesterase family protein [Candidatus Woesearchaeota archaeon]|nr:metallophosphoesterase family protein [Candidatus Woesearchaeota archaeon]